MKRQFPRAKDFAPLLKVRKPQLDPTARRLANAHTIHDLRAIAKRRNPAAPVDYTDGAAEAELSLARARQAFEDIEFHPAIPRRRAPQHLVDARRAGRLPIRDRANRICAMMHTEGERRAAAAGAAGIPFALVDGRNHVHRGGQGRQPERAQLVPAVHVEGSRSFDGAARSGRRVHYDTLLITVDVPVGGARLRDKRNGLTIPPSITAATVLNAIPHPGWWIDFLTTEPLKFASFDRWDGTVEELMDTMFDPTLDFDDLAWIIDHWPNKVVIKGIQTLEDAKKVASMGVHGVLLSNHGGRQLDRAPIPFHLLPEVVREIGSDVEVHVDTGIMSAPTSLPA
jgi:L-lactate dehydrogenase (cytochrome)